MWMFQRKNIEFEESHPKITVYQFGKKNRFQLAPLVRSKSTPRVQLVTIPVGATEMGVQLKKFQHHKKPPVYSSHFCPFCERTSPLKPT